MSHIKEFYDKYHTPIQAFAENKIIVFSHARNKDYILTRDLIILESNLNQFIDYLIDIKITLDKLDKKV